MKGNRWQALPFEHLITENSVLELDVEIVNAAEIQGVGFDTDLGLTNTTLFRFGGSQSSGIGDFPYTNDIGYEHFVIPVGSYFTGEFQYLYFAGDDDANVGGSVRFKNVKLYESGMNTPKYYIRPGETWQSLALSLYGTVSVAAKLELLISNDIDLVEGEPIALSELPPYFINIQVE